MIIVDAHVHLYPCFEVASFLAASYARIKRVSGAFSDGSGFQAVFCLTESSGESAFQRISDHFVTEKLSATAEREWWLHRTEESISVYLQRRDEARIAVVAGRQLVSRDGLEVLAIGTHRHFAQGVSTGEMIKNIAEAGAIPILPWGVGKWLGKRGRVLEELLADRELPAFFLGDSGNRPAFWPRPALFRKAARRGIYNLPGSDPLPFQSEYGRAGRCGFVLRGQLNLTAPAQDLKQRLLDGSTEPQTFGNHEKALRFVRNQAAMQYRKLRNKQ